VSLTTPASVQKLQMALHAKAKESPGLRFYVLYDKVYRKDILSHAYLCCKANGGAAGVDGSGSRIIQFMERALAGRTGARAEKSNLSTLASASGYIPKADGKSKRPLGIPLSVIGWRKRRRC